MLIIENLNVYYDGIKALKNVSLEVHTGEIVAIIGANGAGKSTLLRAISGLITPAEGCIYFGSRKTDLTKLKPHQIVELGVGHVPEGRRIFTNMSVKENLLLGAYTKPSDNHQDDMNRIFEMFPRLKERFNQLAGTLSGGEQQMLAIGRALMMKPKLLLMDEPSLGLAPNLVMEIMKTILRINQEGVTALLVEQNAHLALEISHRGYVFETGSVVMTDTGKNLLTDDRVKTAYLGG